jgi:hypothetical protein
VPAADPLTMGDLTKRLPNLAAQLEDIKTQSRVRQAVGAGFLLGSVVLAVTSGPTVAIVFATLAIAAVWLFPSIRRRVLHDSLVLRDARGAIRLAAVINEHGSPQLALFDASGTPRLTLGLSDDDTPALALTDKEGRIRLGAVVSTSESGWMIFGVDGDVRLEAVDSGSHPWFAVHDPDRGRSHLAGGLLGIERGEQSATVGVTDTSTLVNCTSASRQVSIRAGEEVTGLVAGVANDTTVIAAVSDGDPCLIARKDKAIAQARVGGEAATISANKGDGEACLLVVDDAATIVAASAGHRVRACASRGGVDVSSNLGEAGWTSLTGAASGTLPDERPAP